MLEGFSFCGRCERIRTFDPLHPMQVRYQAAPHTEDLDYMLKFGEIWLIGQKKITNSQKFRANHIQGQLTRRFEVGNILFT